MKRLSLVGILAIVLAMLPLYNLQAANPLDFDVTGGHFYKQANGQGGDGELGFAVTDEGGIPFWTWFVKYGGVANVGYPISQRFVWQGFTVQAFQKVVFQWRPDSGRVDLINVFDELSNAGKDDWLFVVRTVPKAADSSSDKGKTWEQVVESHFSLLDQNPAIKAVFFGAADPIALNGLPLAVQDYGDVFVVRAQRKVFQQWKKDTPWAKAGDVTVANGGDVAREAGLFPESALIPIASSTQPAANSPASSRPNYQSVDPRDLEKNPDAFNGIAVAVSGEVFNIRESGGETFLQLWADSPAGPSATIAISVRYGGSLPGVYEKTRVTVYGVGAGTSRGTNAFGGVISQPLIRADKVAVGSQAGPPPVGLNTTVRSGNFEYSVTEIKKSKAVYAYGDSRIAKGIYVLVFMTDRNVGPGTDTFSSVDLVVQDAKGNTYEEDSSATLNAKYQFGKDWDLTDSNPGVQREIVIAYDVPEGSTGLVLVPKRANGPTISLP